MYDAGDRKSVRRLEKAARLAQAQRLEIIRGIMSVAPGRAWVLEKLEDSHIFAASFSSDPLQMAFAEGERNIGLKLLNDLMAACPDQYMVMMHERNQRDAARDTADRRSSTRRDGDDSGSSLETGIDYDSNRDEEGNPAFDGYEKDGDGADRQNSTY